MATKRRATRRRAVTKRSARRPRAGSAGAPPEPPARNERPPRIAKNEFPRAAALDLRRLGPAGVRHLVERGLGAVHEFGDEQWKALGVSKLELARNREVILDSLKQIVADVDRNAFTNRTAAVVMMGELGKKRVLPELEAVLTSTHERETTRGWAGITLGRVGGTKAVEVLGRQMAGASPILRRRLVYALGETRSRQAVPVLSETARKDPDPVVANTAYETVRGLEKRLSLQPARISRRRVPRGGGVTRSAR